MFKKIDLKNKTALVTGAGKGLGKACAIALAEAGAKVIVISRTLSDLTKVERLIKKTKGSCLKFECDVTDVYKFKSILKKVKTLDILVNNAGNNRPEHFTQVKKDNMVKDFNNLKVEELNKVLAKFNIKIQDYMSQNSIDIVLNKNNIFIGKVSSDITKSVLVEINDDFKKE